MHDAMNKRSATQDKMSDIFVMACGYIQSKMLIKISIIKPQHAVNTRDVHN